MIQYASMTCPKHNRYADFHANGAENGVEACRAAKTYANFIPANSEFSELYRLIKGYKNGKNPFPLPRQYLPQPNG